MSRRLGPPLLAVVVAMAAGACSGAAEPRIDPPPDRTTLDLSGLGERDEAADDGTTLVAEATGDTLEVWVSPVESDRPAQVLDASDQVNGRLVLVAKQQLGPSWLEVYLPTAPAGSTGWVRREDVSLTEHRFRVEVRLSEHELVVYLGDTAAVETPAAIGAADVPPATPGLFIKDLVETPEPGGPYGRYAYGLSGSSNTLEDFQRGSGVIAIHGTNDESTLGTSVEGGSIAIGEEPLALLVGNLGLPLGTPVEIVP